MGHLAMSLFLFNKHNGSLKLMNIIKCLSSKQILWYQNRYLLPYSGYSVEVSPAWFALVVTVVATVVRSGCLVHRKHQIKLIMS